MVLKAEDGLSLQIRQPQGGWLPMCGHMDTLSFALPLFFSSTLLAATSEAGIVMHDIMGGIALLVMLLLGIFIYRHQKRSFRGDQHLPEETRLGRKLGQVQLWIIFGLVAAGIAAYFFVLPRATSLRDQPAPNKRVEEQRVR